VSGERRLRRVGLRDVPTGLGLVPRRGQGGQAGGGGATAAPGGTATHPANTLFLRLQTATINGTVEDLREFAPLVRVLEKKVGRLVFNGFPTGIEVCPSMHHGGPYPAASHSFFTSIGTASIYRFVRPVCYQGFPEEALPELLQDANPRGAMRIVDGEMKR